ncbi:MAG: isochorismate synthase MenF [Phormidesmis sp.]
MDGSPVTATLMPAAFYGTDFSEAPFEAPQPSEALDQKTAGKITPEKAETFRFLTHCQQQAIQTNHPKIASITFPIAPTAPWVVLSALGQSSQRHFYYDSPQQWAIVGLGVAVGCSAAGPLRFEQAQAFTQTWKTQFIYAKNNSKADLAGRFFCSATFFDHPTKASTTSSSSIPQSQPFTVAPSYFEPTYLFVPQVQVMTLTEGSTVTFNYLITATSEAKQTTAHIYEQLRQINIADDLGGARQASHKTVSKDVASFEGAVTEALGQLNQGRLHKVVLADVMDVVAPQAIDVVRSLQTLRKNHPDCTVFSVGNGQGQSFIGASPERLLSLNEGRLTTDALAGSASRGQTPEADRDIAQALLNSEKERYEHQVVVEFIVRQLRSLGLSPDYTSKPHILPLSNIQHLHTPITAQIDQHAVSPLKVLAKLHPTPAVAGLPRSLACQLIRQHETFDRSLYTAPLGWIDTNGNSEFIVGIRSALIDGCKARLYAGAGIVSGSEPDKELAEIRLKLQTLLNALV